MRRTSHSPLAFLILAAGIALGSPTYGETPAYRDRTRPVEDRVADLLGRLTPAEKLSLLAGTGFESQGVPRLGVPPLRMADGPNGVRWGLFATAYPTGIALAASWDPALAERVGRSLGRETQAKGRQVLLAPCVNLTRVPQNGRNFEGMGEDPYLASRVAVGYIRGVQAEGTVATVKHFCCNEQEYRRMDINVQVDERTLRELYLPPFEAAVREAGVWAVMTAYNKINGQYASENQALLAILKKEWGFTGLVMSDWGAVHSTVPSALAGLDLEMPDGQWFAPGKLQAPLQRGEISQALIDDKVTRFLRVAIASGAFDRDGKEQPDAAVNSPNARAVALDAARGSVVLLKSTAGVLPLAAASHVRSVAVIGPGAIFPRASGGGSAGVRPREPVKALDALSEKLRAKDVRVTYAQGFALLDDVEGSIPASALFHREGDKLIPGLRADYFANRELRGKPVLTRIEPLIDFEWADGSPGPAVPNDEFSSRFSGVLVPPAAGRYQIGLTANDAARVLIDGQMVVDKWSTTEGDQAKRAKLALPEVTLSAGPHELLIEHYEGKGTARVRLAWAALPANPVAEALATAKAADVAVVFVGLSALHEAEAFDHPELLTLPADQVALIRAVAKVNRRTVVVLSGGSPQIVEPWINDVAAVLHTFYSGQEGGRATAEVLLGEINPSGKLPFTIFRHYTQHPARTTYPEKDGVAAYSEGVFMGYRHWDAKKLPVTFPFGHGLSYTTFAYDRLTAAADASRPGVVRVGVRVRNTGKQAGAEVVQVYVGPSHPRVARPPRELKAFEKVLLAAGEEKTLGFELPLRAFATWDTDKHDWVADAGAYDISAGSSSRDLRVRTKLRYQPPAP